MGINVSVEFFFSFRETTQTRFAQIFSEGTGKEDSNIKTLTKKWGWYNIIFALCNENILNTEPVTKLELYLILTYMCYKQDMDGERNNNYNQFKK